jgi:redox-sensitive bicupin YhaK (pirin superfamily)
MQKKIEQIRPGTLQPSVLQQEGVHLRLASGTYEGNTGPLNSLTPVISIVGEIEKGRRVQLTATPGYRTLLYVANGEVMINGETISRYHLVVFEKDNDEIILAACENAQIVYLSVAPTDERTAAKENKLCL